MVIPVAMLHVSSRVRVWLAEPCLAHPGSEVKELIAKAAALATLTDQSHLVLDWASDAV